MKRFNKLDLLTMSLFYTYIFLFEWQMTVSQIPFKLVLNLMLLNSFCTYNFETLIFVLT